MHQGPAATPTAGLRCVCGASGVGVMYNSLCVDIHDQHFIYITPLYVLSLPAVCVDADISRLAVCQDRV